jgi:hypothetical protein
MLIGRGGGLEIIVERTKYVLLAHHQTAGESCDRSSKQIVIKCVTVQIFGNDGNK